MPRITSAVRLICLYAALGLWLGGCGGASPESFTPAGDVSRQALEMSLAAWQSGKKPEEVGTLPDQSAVKVVDSDWVAGKKLKSFEIKSEAQAAASADSVARQFSVQLQFDGGQPQDVTYHVVGKGEMWVFRDKDYVQSQGM